MASRTPCHRSLRTSITVVIVICQMISCAAHATASGRRSSGRNVTWRLPGHHPSRRLCGPAAPHSVTCDAIVLTDRASQGGRGVHPHFAAAGYGPADLRAAYALPGGSAGRGATVAVVEAYDDPNVEADLATYRANYGLPPCRLADGCLRKIDERGGGDYPRADPGWAGETSLDLEMVSAICPACHLLIVEADSTRETDLAAAEDTAARLRANAISNSYGGPESPWDARVAAAYRHPGTAITVSSGDAGYGVDFPASSPYVTAVGGTSLLGDGHGHWTETAWSGGGSGCSHNQPRPPWQNGTNCDRRAVADVAAVADPQTGLAVYDSYHAPGWQIVGGTSAAAPIIAGVYALAGNTSSSNGANQPYAHPEGLNDVTHGSNGDCGSLLCRAGPGYDGPTGLGTPNGLRAF